MPPGVRARALMARAELAFEQQDYRAAGEYAQAGLDLCRSSASPGAAAALRVLALVSLRAGRLEDALAQRRRRGHRRPARTGMTGRKGSRSRSGPRSWPARASLDEAQQAYEDALDVLRDNNGWGVAQTLYGFGSLARARGDHAAALRPLPGARWRCTGRSTPGPRSPGAWPASGGWRWPRATCELAASSLTESLQLSLATGQRLAIARGLEAFATLAVAERRPGPGGPARRAPRWRCARPSARRPRPRPSARLGGLLGGRPRRSWARPPRTRCWPRARR